MPQKHLPLYHRAMPWPYKLLALGSVLYGLQKTFKITHLHVFTPFILSFLATYIFYISTVLFTPRKHVLFIPHLLNVIFAFFTYGNVTLLVMQNDITLAPLCNLICMQHFLFHTGKVLENQQSLFPSKDIARVTMNIVSMLLPLTTYLFAPRTNPSFEGICAMLFVPEFVGCLISAIFHLRYTVT